MHFEMDMIELLQASDWQRLKTIRLSAMRDSPDAFASTLERALNLDDSDWEKGVRDLPTFIAVTNRIDQGMVRCAPHTSQAGIVFIISMWVAPGARNKGLGEKLINAAIEWAQSEGHTRLVLDVADENASAIALYEKSGFKPTGETGTLPSPREHITEHRRALAL